MARKRYTPEEIIQHLHTVELEQGNGLKLEQAAKKVGVTPQTIVRWRNEYGGMKVDQAKRLKELAEEYGRYGYRPVIDSGIFFRYFLVSWKFLGPS
jgi:transcriptional regulator with XRE-family HTH domain